MIAQQPDIDCVRIEECGWEPLNAVSEDRASYCSRIDLVELAWLAFAATGGAHQLRCDPQHSPAGSDERMLEPPAGCPSLASTSR